MQALALATGICASTYACRDPPVASTSACTNPGRVFAEEAGGFSADFRPNLAPKPVQHDVARHAMLVADARGLTNSCIAEYRKVDLGTQMLA